VGLNAAPNALVELVKTTPEAPLASAVSRILRVPQMFVSTKARRECVAT